MIVVHATVPVDPDRRAEVESLIEEMVARSREEPGTISYDAAADLESDATIHFVERYEDEAALDAHFESDHYEAFATDLGEYLTGRPSVTRYDVESSTELQG